MNKKLLKSLLAVLVLSTSPAVTYAQLGSKLNNLKEKVTGNGGNTTTEGSTDKKGGGLKSSGLSREERLLREDVDNTFLDQREYVKDSKGVGGIYYSNAPIIAANDLQNQNMILGKFLIEYVENPDKGKTVLKISNRHSYEENNRNKYVQPITYISTSAPTSLNIEINDLSGHIAFGSSNYISYMIPYQKFEQNLQGVGSPLV